MAHGKSLELREIQPVDGHPMRITMATENSLRRRHENALAKGLRTTRKRVAKMEKKARRT